MTAPDTGDPFGLAGTPLEKWQASEHLQHVAPISLDELVPAGTRLVVAAPHPDDEVLACGGLLAAMASRHDEVTLLSVTDGDGSHPGSSVWPPARLRHERHLESTRALTRLGFDTRVLDWHPLGLPDGQVATFEDELLGQLCRHLGRGDRLLSTWRYDGHCDHEALGKVAAEAARISGAVLLEAPVWAWHWAEPQDPRLPWARARKFMLSEQAQGRKRQAIAEHVTQLLPDASTRAAPVLNEQTLARLLQPFELVFV
ncbi:PIG-L deacetylase family protein [Pseudomonas typographi]|uniref:PIG-L family deacetylase n=1 Tax=Pseudomonas typographi TaxID=2715964 RepID=A0ABR7Z1C9_9PSED|nr:PIG-L family deacetylase [Pseudomonas typographi]MBD1551677.1 PIG-L family deacetylase [Pseudomonas typographi]MBD1587068.1 PIG-L family deacetylase [Pseudomonas typographi]MBD1599306.1 PIG-L family deacetylase [Pseudomonas typographi]